MLPWSSCNYSIYAFPSKIDLPDKNLGGYAFDDIKILSSYFKYESPILIIKL